MAKPIRHLVDSDGTEYDFAAVVPGATMSVTPLPAGSDPTGSASVDQSTGVLSLRLGVPRAEVPTDYLKALLSGEEMFSGSWKVDEAAELPMQSGDFGSFSRARVDYRSAVSGADAYGSAYVPLSGGQTDATLRLCFKSGDSLVESYALVRLSGNVAACVGGGSRELSSTSPGDAESHIEVLGIYGFEV